MSVGFGGLEIARSGMVVSERGLDVTGHNISNVNTPGYSRQQAISATANYQNMIKYQVGLGAQVEEVRQIRQTFLDNVYRNEDQTLGYWEAKQNTYTDIQSIVGETFDDSENGLQSTLNQFWDSWQELSKDPSNLTIRATVKQRGEMLSEFVNHLGTQLEKAQSDLDSEIKDDIGQVNLLTKDIAQLNLKIVSAESTGDHANDLRDQGNLDIDKLNKLIGCQATEMSDGQVDITVGGFYLVTKSTAETVTAVQNTTGSLFCAPAINGGKTLLPIESGTLKGIMESRGEVAGNKMSLDNGNFSDKIDLVFAFNTDDSDAQMKNIQDSIDSTVKYYTDRGISVRLGYTTFGSSGTSATKYENVTDGIPDIVAFKKDIGNIHFDNDTTGAFTTAGNLTKALEGAISATDTVDLDPEWGNASKQVVLLSDHGVDPTKEDVNQLASELSAADMHTMVISSQNQFGVLASATGDQFIDSSNINATTPDGVTMDEAVSESLRNDIYGNVANTNNSIPDVKTGLNEVINAVIREVNNLQKSGVTLGNESHPGEDFFVPIDPSYPMQMGNIMLNPNLSDLSNIVASTNASSGDNTVALAISNLRDSVLLGKTGDVQSIDGFYQSLVMAIGSKGNEATNNYNSQNTLVFSIDGQRQAIMGVSMDEEMSNMMKYQYAYGASSKVINAMTEMLDTIIQKLGLVGR